MDTDENKVELQKVTIHMLMKNGNGKTRNETINKSNMRNNICIEQFDKDIANKESYGNRRRNN